MDYFLILLICCAVYTTVVGIGNIIFYYHSMKKFQLDVLHDSLHALELDVSRLRYERDCMRIELNDIKSYLIGPEYKNSDKEGEQSDC